MNKFEVEISTTLTVTKKDIDDIMATALEGGINHWCSEVEVIGDYLGDFASDQISRGGVLKLYDAEEDLTYLLTLNELLHGIKKACEHHWFANYGWCDGETLDTSQIDAEVADVIVQLAIFDDVIFG